MRTTLFYIPAEVAGLPLFGFGVLLAVWLVVCFAMGVWVLRRRGKNPELISILTVAGMGAVLIFLLAGLVERTPQGVPLGVPVRGYGVMLMVATIASVALAAYRARQVGIDAEVIYSLAFTMFIAGIIGARVFYVIEYWQLEFAPARTGSVAATLLAILNVPKGGLVVYGSVLFGVPAGIWFCLQRKLAPLEIGDIIAPSMLLGQSLGRVGCFLNGCCYGGVCLGASYAVTFPADSPPYLQHMSEGWRTGVWLAIEGEQVTVAYVSPALAAVLPGLRPGSTIVGINGAEVSTLADARHKLATATGGIELETADGQVLRWQSPPPPRSVPVHPAQLYAAIDAALLALVLWLYFTYRRRRGEVFAILLIVHPASRFLLEMIRVDEPGQLGTSLSISQWISMLIVLLGIALLAYVETRPRLPPHPQIS